MSTTIELVRNLRNKAITCEAFNVVNIGKLLNQAADVIEELSAKVAQQNMEKSSQYYNGEWIPVKEKLPESESCEVCRSNNKRIIL